jgi:hypothetical protein
MNSEIRGSRIQIWLTSDGPLCIPQMLLELADEVWAEDPRGMNPKEMTTKQFVAR